MRGLKRRGFPCPRRYVGIPTARNNFGCSRVADPDRVAQDLRRRARPRAKSQVFNPIPTPRQNFPRAPRPSALMPVFSIWSRCTERFRSTRRRRQPLRPPSSPTVASSMPRMAFSTRAASRRAAATVPGGCTGRGAVSELVQFPRVRALSSSLRAYATPTASNDKPSSCSASQSLRCRSRHEWSAVEVS